MKVPFNVSAKTARLIGRENVSNLEGALTELIKNTYDADATMCIIYYEKSTDSLFFCDNGCGMTQDIVINNWMTIGNSTKTIDLKTSRGRIKTGEKGIGRFALDRISSYCFMHTISQTSNFNWIIDWDTFEENDLLTETYAVLEESELSFTDMFEDVLNNEVRHLIEKKFLKTGTCFKLNNLRDLWGGELLERLRVTFSSLIPPYDDKSFGLYFFEEDTLIKDAKVKSAFVDSYDYKVEFKLDKNYLSTIRIHRNEFDFGNRFDEIMHGADFSSEDRSYFKGKEIVRVLDYNEIMHGLDESDLEGLDGINGVLYFYKLKYQINNSEKFFYKEFSNRKANFKEISGVKVYRDNFIVRPYGFFDTFGYDWLDLSTRRAMSPAAPSHKTGNWRVQANQMFGQIFISRLNNSLPDKSSREGIVETKGFNVFREYLTSIIQLFEQDRQYVIRKIDKYNKKIAKGEEALENAKQAIKNSKDSSKGSSEDDENTTNDNTSSQNKGNEEQSREQFETFKKAIEYQEEVIESLETEMGLLRTLATSGIIVNTYIHEIKSLTQKMNMGIKETYELLTEDDNKEEAIDELKKLRALRKDFNSWFSITLDSVKKDKRKRVKTNINKLIESSCETWDSVHSDYINYEIDDDVEVEIRCFPYDFESIINNLITNSFFVFKTNVVENPTIRIKIGRENDYNFIEFIDNGPGLSEGFLKKPDKILEQHETDKRDANNERIGTGMGLWIVKNIVQEYTGYIDLSYNCKENPGFGIKIYFKGRTK